MDIISDDRHDPQPARPGAGAPTGGVVTLGESMGLLTVPSGRRLRSGGTAPLGFGGAESNVAIGLARLGVPVTWVSRVGDDALGSLVVRELRGEGVRTMVAVDAAAQTGLMVKEERHGIPWRVRYYRAGSAASRLSPDDVDAAAVRASIASARVLHVTGITPALSPTARAAVRHAVGVARAHGVHVSFDVNYRAGLWSPAAAGPVLADLCRAADLVFASPEEAAVVLGEADPGDQPLLARRLAALGPATVVLKLGAGGAMALRGGEVVVVPAEPVEVVDPVGAGDAFVAGYLSAMMQDLPLADCLRLGNRIAGLVCRVRGDWEGLPTSDELAADATAHKDVQR